MGERDLLYIGIRGRRSSRVGRTEIAGVIFFTEAAILRRYRLGLWGQGVRGMTLRSRSRTSLRSVCTSAVFCQGKLSVSPRLLLQEAPALSPPIRDRDLQLDIAGRVLDRDLYLQATIFGLLPHM
ncbi:unnamed protein product [Linum trigynum]|uniref:Uncharacterized protein n=1 Tax=Linum trigynum TaxID=586398 RepID=A0AAV2G809_9ROSI